MVDQKRVRTTAKEERPVRSFDMIAHNLLGIGEVKFCVYSSNTDAYTNFIRSAYKLHPEVTLAIDLLNTGQVLVDLGANIGGYSFAIAKKLGVAVVGFEALPDNVVLLNAGVKANGFADFTVEACAISDKTGTLHFKGDSAYGKVTRDGGVEVPAITLDSYVERMGDKIERVGLVKIDIEGMEFEALDGGVEFFRRAGYPPVIFESNLAHLYASSRSHSNLLKRFMAMGYKLYCIVGRYLVPCEADFFQDAGLINYLAIRRDISSIGSGRIIGQIPFDQRLGLLRRTLTEMAPGYRDYIRQHAEGIPIRLRTKEIVRLARLGTAAVE